MNKNKEHFTRGANLLFIQLDHDSMSVGWRENSFGQIVATWYERFVL